MLVWIFKIIEVRGAKKYYYAWDGKGAHEFMTFENPTDYKTAKLFRYTQEQLDNKRGVVNLQTDKPALVGKAVVEVLRKYANDIKSKGY